MGKICMVQEKKFPEYSFQTKGTENLTDRIN
ncbi:hypothetical protein SBDP1_10050 [Syntrophobacter sp. SbD1]|nr:hypothetical protein SBDP1_10050 [Syntrophobacter sp. SbD1]